MHHITHKNSTTISVKQAIIRQQPLVTDVKISLHQNTPSPKQRLPDDLSMMENWRRK
jgi:hypothetical protein